MATHQRSKRLLATLLLLTLCATWVPLARAQYITGGPAAKVGTFPPPIPTPLRPDASEILLDVAAHSPNLIIRLNTNEDIEKLNIDPFVRVKMYYAIAYGSWIVTTVTPVTSGKWTGRPWLAIGGHARYFYFANEDPSNYGNPDVTDQGGVVGVADGKAVTDFGSNLADIGLGLAALGNAKGGPAGKAAAGIGLGIAGIGIGVKAIGLGIQVAEDLANPSPKQGHVDPNEPTGMPAAGGPPGSDPNGPTGPSPTGIGVNGNGNAPSGGISGSGDDGTGTGFGDPGED